MEKIQINPSRLQWCCNTLDIDIDYLSIHIKIAKQTLEQAMQNQAVLSVKQLEKIANFFKRNLLFFIDPSEIQENKIYSIQFRTINNQEPIHSPKLRAFIERIEKQRQVYLDLLEDINEPVKDSWKNKLEFNTNDIKLISANIRQWLNLPINYKFDDVRQAVESKGIMVFISNGYNGKWQIEKNEHVRGFSLFYDILPIIVIRKQVSVGAQAFTLMHELAHLLLHKESAIDNEENFYSYQGKEKEANEFAGNLLIPDNFLNQIDVCTLINLDITQYDEYLKKFKQSWCVSGEAILVRLLINNKISNKYYQSYKNYKKDQLEKMKKVQTGPIPRSYRYREPIKMFGKPFVYAVFDAFHNKNITLSKASTYLDNLKISDIRKLEKYV
ncbi:MAG: ImmA/IrrE family metallo-endopeptidase [Sulfurimonas sp.]|nr:ImmA/IrrE family metallo-endopeptidase [Sulfurimonas sp.]